MLWRSWITPRWAKNERHAHRGLWRDRMAVLLALAAAACAACGLLLSKELQILMPGPLASAHGGIEKCSACHTKSGSGKLSWIQGLVAGDPLADSKACLTCHKMPATSFNAHGADIDVLKKSTERLVKIAATSPAPHSARAQSFAFPAEKVLTRELYCATCHQEHQGSNSVSTLTNGQCRSCHVLKFDSFDGNHPDLNGYPFKRRTRVIYDHAAHFSKHYPEVAKKNPAQRIPATCAACHNSRDDKRIMAVAPFEETCAACHLDQITGKARVSGPKGIAFLSLPGLDLISLKKKNAVIGEWPDAPDGALTPFMKVMIGRTGQGRALIKSVEKLNLQDLSQMSDEEVKAVTALVWEIKALFFSLISGKAADTFGKLEIDVGVKPPPILVSDLTASISRDVIVAAQQRWLPNLAKEIANGPGGSDVQADDGRAEAAQALEAEKAALSPPSGETSQPDAPGTPKSGEEPPPLNDEAGTKKRDALPCLVRLFGECLVSKAQDVAAEKDEREDAATDARTGSRKGAASLRERPGAMRAGLNDVRLAEGSQAEGGGATSEVSREKQVPAQQPKSKAPDQSDDLLFPTPEELREIEAHTKARAKSAKPDDEPVGATPKPAASAPVGTAAQAQTRAAPELTVDSGVDPENWAEYGGWYLQDYAIFYRPAGHKDKFIASWLTLTGPVAPQGTASPAAAVFDFLTSKDAQGSCAKCHSVDEVRGKGRAVNFSPLTVERKQGRFTQFVHEPHFGISGERGCLSCHELDKDRPYLKSYEQGNPHNFVSGFSAVKKDRCQTCHTAGKARQDCLACHKYHVNDAIAPITNTKLPAL